MRDAKSDLANINFPRFVRPEFFSFLFHFTLFNSHKLKGNSDRFYGELSLQSADSVENEAVMSRMT